MPECWESCGACSAEAVLVCDIHVAPGGWVDRDAPMIPLETDKTTLDIPAPRSGRVTTPHIGIGDPVTEGTLILTLEPD